jgi:uncharacterized protein (TIGR00725 family)
MAMSGLRRDASDRIWTTDGAQVLLSLTHDASERMPAGVTNIPAGEAASLLLGRGSPRLPVGVIGPNDANGDELAQAAAVGRAIASVGFPLICGGRGGCMEAASRAATEAGGLVIGILPSSDWRTANASVTVPLASGLGEARNAIIASACFALVAVGGGHGTLSEMALGMKLGRLVVAMPGALPVPGTIKCETADAAIEAVALRYLGGAP